MKNVHNKSMYTYGILFMIFVISICNTTQGIILSDYIIYYDLESSRQGLMSAIQSAGNIVGLLIIGIILGRLKKSTILIASAIIVPIVFFIMGSKPSLFALLLSYGIYGIAFALWDSLSSSLMVDIHPSNSSRYMNLLHGVFGLGGIVGPLLFQGLDGIGFIWNQMLTIAGIIAVMAFIVYTIGVIPIIRSNHGRIEKVSNITFLDVKSFLSKKRNILLIICAFLYGAHQIGITVWMTRFISDYLETPQWGPGAISIFWVGIAASRLAVSIQSIKPEKLILFGHLISGFAIACGIFIGNGFIMFICCGIAGFAEGPILPMTLDIACSWEKGKTSLGSSLVLFVHYIGFIITPPLIGALIFTNGIKVGMIIPAILSLIATIFAFFLKKRRELYE